MAQLDLVRAKKLLKSAQDLFKEGDIAGVAGLAYQGFEAATTALEEVERGLKTVSAMIRKIERFLNEKTSL